MTTSQHTRVQISSAGRRTGDRVLLDDQGAVVGEQVVHVGEHLVPLGDVAEQVGRQHARRAARSSPSRPRRASCWAKPSSKGPRRPGLGPGLRRASRGGVHPDDLRPPAAASSAPEQGPGGGARTATQIGQRTAARRSRPPRQALDQRVRRRHAGAVIARVERRPSGRSGGLPRRRCLGTSSVVIMARPSSSGVGMRLAGQPAAPQQDSEGDHREPETEVLDRDVPGDRTPSISVRVVDDDRVGQLGQPAVDRDLEGKDDHHEHQYWAVRKIPVLNQASSSTTTAITAITVSRVYSGTATRLNPGGPGAGTVPERSSTRPTAS